MRIDTLGVQAFIAIADQASFSRAAESLHITQTALSRRVQNLEAFLGVKLVERTTRSVALTPIGRAFLPQAHRLHGELTAALVEIRETGRAQRGDVTIACVPTVGIRFLPRILKAYVAQYPGNRVRILDQASSGVTDAVRRREAEFGIQIAGPQDPELVSESLVEDRFVLICRGDHALAKRKRLAWRQLEPHPLVFVGAESGNRPLLDGALAGERPHLRAHYEVQRSSTALGLVAAGVAAAIVPSLAVQEGAYPNLRVVPLVQPVVTRSLVLVTRKGAQLSPAAQALFELVKSER